MIRRAALFIVTCGASLGVVALVSPSAHADYFDFNTGRIVCTSYQCSVSQALSSGDISRATQAANAWHQAEASRAANAFSALVQQQAASRNVSSGIQAPTAPVSTTDIAYANNVASYYANVEQYNASLGVSQASAPTPPPSPYDLGCIASSPNVIVTYTSRMPTFTWVDSCPGTYEIKWGYTRDGNSDLSVDYFSAGWLDRFTRISSGNFTPPFPQDPSFNGVWFSIYNWKGRGPFDPFGSTGYASFPARNQPNVGSVPNPPAILPDTPEALNRARVAALTPQTSAKPAAGTPAATSIKCLNKATSKKQTFTGKWGKLQKCPTGWVKQ